MNLLMANVTLMTIESLPDSLVAQMIDQSEDNRMEGSTSQEARTRRQRNEHTWHQKEEQNRDEQGHQRVKHGYTIR